MGTPLPAADTDLQDGELWATQILIAKLRDGDVGTAVESMHRMAYVSWEASRCLLRQPTLLCTLVEAAERQTQPNPPVAATPSADAQHDHLNETLSQRSYDGQPPATQRCAAPVLRLLRDLGTTAEGRTALLAAGAVAALVRMLHALLQRLDSDEEEMEEEDSQEACAAALAALRRLLLPSHPPYPGDETLGLTALAENQSGQLLRRLYRYFAIRRDDPDGGQGDNGDVAAVLARLAMAMPVVPTAAASAVATADALLAPLGLYGFLADHWERRPVHLPAPQSHRSSTSTAAKCSAKLATHRTAGTEDGGSGSGGPGGGGASRGGGEGGDWKGEGECRFEAIRMGVMGSDEEAGAQTMIRRLTTLPPAAADQLDPVVALAELAEDPHAHFGGGARHLVDVRLVRCCGSVTTSNGGDCSDKAAGPREECWRGGGGGGGKGGGGDDDDDDDDGRWLVDEAAVVAAAAEGYSVTLRAATLRGSAAAAATAAALARALGLSVSGNVYVTPSGARGLQEHYDDHCVLVLQLRGRKRWRVRSAAAAGVVLPQLYAPRRRPRPSARAADERPHTDEGDTVHYTLAAGDVLYIPRGWPHQATAMQEEQREERGVGSVHLTLAVEVEPPFDWEGALHHALRAWALANAPGGEGDASEQSGDHGKRRRTGEVTDVGAEGGKAALEFGRCQSAEQQQQAEEVWWVAEAMLHVAMAAAACAPAAAPLRRACLAAGAQADGDAADARVFAALLADLATADGEDEASGDGGGHRATRCFAGEMRFEAVAATVTQQLQSHTPPWERLAWLGLVERREGWVGWDPLASLEDLERRLRRAVEVEIQGTGEVKRQYAELRRRFVSEARWEQHARPQLRKTAATYWESRARLGAALQALHGLFHDCEGSLI